MKPTLSHSLQIMRHWFDEIREGRAEFTAEGAAAFSGLLREAVDIAERLEATAETLAGSLDHYGAAMRAVAGAMEDDQPDAPSSATGANVVQFRRPRELHYVPIDGGDAA
jgi:hypothetical protein